MFLPLILTGKNRKYTNQVAEGRILPTFKEVGQMLVTFFLAVIGWIIFRSAHIHDFLRFLSGVCDASLFTMPWFQTMNSLLLMVGSALLMLLVEWIQRAKEHGLAFGGNPKYELVRMAFYLMITLMVFVLQAPRTTQFIYFQF